MSTAYLITCEHAVNDVPESLREVFKGQDALLQSHRGWDPGAWKLAGRIAMVLGAPLLLGSCSRLVVDLNRAEENPECFSDFTRSLPTDQKEALLEKYHRRFRCDAENMIEIARDRGQRVVHLSIHSFTPELAGQVRDAEVGLLYDPARAAEVALCEGWLALLRQNYPGIRVKPNYPYLGTDDGLTTWLRARFPSETYAGIELEMNHGPLLTDKGKWDEACDAVVATLQRAVAG